MKVDLLLTNASVYNVYLKKWLMRDVAVSDGVILYTGDAAGKGFEPETILDCGGKPLIPGMVDIHLHIESSYCTPLQFARAVVPRGVTTVVSEPHEMANVFGKEGIEEMIRLSEGCGIDIYYGVPSSVPSTRPELETSGGVITPEDGAWLFDHYPEIICVGEVMTYASLLAGDVSGTRSFLKAIRRRNVLPAVEGHCPWIKDLDLARVMFEGIDSDHCLQDPETMLQRFEQGMFVELQYKSITPEVIDVLKGGEYTGLYSFVTDDTAPDLLVSQGHLDGVVRKALSLGLSLEEAVMACTLAPSRRMGFRDRGAVSPGKIADFLLLKDKSGDFEIEKVFKDGREAGSAEGKGNLIPVRDRFKNSLRIGHDSLNDSMFNLVPPAGQPKARVRSIIKNSADTYTREGERVLEVRDGLALWEHQDCNLLVVMERHSGTGCFSQGLLEGCFFTGGAAASSHTHDSHNILIAGDNREDMKLARQWVIDHRGGICVFSKGKILAGLELPVGGILSEEPMEELAGKMTDLSGAMRVLGFDHPNPQMSFSTLTLLVSPAVKISDKGIVDTEKGEILSLFL